MAQQGAARSAGMMPAMAMKMRHTEVGLPADGKWLDGILAHHPEVAGLVVLAERGGGTLATSRGAFLGKALEDAGFATLHVGLLSHEEDRRASDVWHQVPALTQRLAAVLEWIGHQPALRGLALGITARDAAAGAMVRLAGRGGALPIRALASRAGRPDLAGMEYLRSLAAPMLLLVGELDGDNLPANRQVLERLDCPRELAVVAGASRGFEEPGKLDEAGQILVRWFGRWLAAAPVSQPDNLA